MRGTAKRWLGALVAVVMTAGLLATGSPAHAASATFQGTITDLETGSPVAGACVGLFRTPSAPDTEACTDADGRYSITDAVLGYAYRVRIRAEGYADKWHPYGVDFTSGGAVSSRSTPTVIDATITRFAGTLRGRVTRQDGSPAASVNVLAYPVGQNTPIRALTRTDGEFRLDNLPAGGYQLLFSGAGYPAQYAPGKTTRADAGTFTVTSGAETVVNEQFLPRTPMPTVSTGALKGAVLALATGAPLADACATIYRPDWFVAAVTCTDAAGTYRATLPSGGPYRVLIRHPGDPDVWAPSAASPLAAASYGVSPNLTTTADVAVGDAPYGATIRGRIIDYTGTAPSESVTLRATRVDGRWSVATKPGPDGTYEFSRLPAGDYRVSAVATRTVAPNTTTQITQWFPQKRTEAEADILTVGSGQVLVRDETLIGPAALDLTLLDDATGAPVTTACVHVGRETQCGAADGIYHFTRIWGATTTTAVVRDTLHLEERVENIPVASGQTARRTVRLRPAGAITTTVARAADGSVPRTCASAVPVAFGARWLSEEENTFCNTDGQGNVRETLTLGPLPSGSYQLFVTAADPYGAQWLGATGGTGDRRVATKVNVRSGSMASAPAIKLDRAGSIAGTLRNRSTGAPLVGYIRPFGLTPGLTMMCGNLPRYTACSGANGTYRLDRLGPYAWPVEFAAAGYASQWSGGATDRFGAKLIPVKAGQTTTLDASLGPEGRILTLDRGPNPPAYWSATAYNAVTGDYAGAAVYHNEPVIGGLNTGKFVIQYDDYTAGVAPCWYYAKLPPTPSPRLPRRSPLWPLRSPVVNVTAGQTVNNLALVPGQTCLPTTPRLLSEPVFRGDYLAIPKSGAWSGSGDRVGQPLPPWLVPPRTSKPALPPPTAPRAIRSAD